MKLIEHQLHQFLGAIDSSSPAPGGGSVSALSALMGVSLARMVGHLTIHRKAFQKQSEQDRTRFTDVFEQLDRLKGELLPLVDADTDAFEGVMAAYRMPKATELEQQRRQDAIQEATVQAIEVPLRVATLGMDALDHLAVILQFGNPNATSDVGVAALQLKAAVHGALMNVRINLGTLTNTDLQSTYLHQVEDITKRLSSLVDGLVTAVEQRL
jgi:formiminotetrahydrofolate cyclodeaminase